MAELNKEQFENLVNNMSLGDDFTAFDYIINFYDLKSYWEHYESTLFPAMERPGSCYHNSKHTKLMVLNTTEGCMHSHLTNAETRLALIAAIYHDANHTCNYAFWDGDSYNHPSSDHWNIVKALLAFDKVNTLSFSNKHSPEQHEIITKAIKSTEFPGKPHAVYTPIQQVLRDADLMTAYCQDSKVRLNLYLGLREEINPHSSLKDFADQQMAFAVKTSTKWNTRWAKVKMIKKNWQAQFRQIHSQLLTSQSVFKDEEVLHP